MRILLAALAGAVAMFLWTAVAHMVTPLGRVDFKQLPNEAPVLAAMASNVGDQDGLYIFPYTDPNDPNMMKKYAELSKTGPSGMLLYRAPGHDHMADAGMGPQLVKEFIKQFLQCLMAAWIVSMIGLGFTTRVGVVLAMGVSSAIATNVSYWNWYGYPTGYTLAQIVMELVSALVAGLAIAATLRWQKA